ncbi:MAG: hypothetical protein H7328_08915 [Bdellovibrio sp.]|nr:hypothetical protein [Bdellovibrio sp.]
MDFNSLVGQTYDHEMEFHELLCTDVENHYDTYVETFVHFYFYRLPNNKIKIAAFVRFGDKADMLKMCRAIITHKESYEVHNACNHIQVSLCRFNQFTTTSAIHKDPSENFTVEGGIEYIDPDLQTPPMTPEELRLAFQELAGCFRGELEDQKSRLKKAI